MKTVETTTPWYTGKVRFDGIPLNKLMDLVGAKGQSVRVLALNDYTTLILVSYTHLDVYKRQPAGWRRRWPSPECIFCAACILPAARWP